MEKDNGNATNHKSRFEAAQKSYWVAFRGELGKKVAILGIGGDSSGKIALITHANPDARVASNNIIQLKTTQEGGTTYNLRPGDKISVYHEDN